jgi:hypothetical protein
MEEEFSLFHSFQIDSGVHPASYLTFKGGREGFSDDKALGA